ncbi:MAG: LysM peptidoglycan-binding domain-containing protein, partial [Paludibacteraceae bacterium]|nr:LysM peptidoglycan-binding domain-containing protein [Paludibacteraceae bacterium]
GESMHDISQKYGIKLLKLYDLNGMDYNEVPKVGRILKLN